MPLTELQCPYCYITISIPIPSGETVVSFSHDCPSCCNTMQVEAELDAGTGAVKDVHAQTV